MKVALSCLLNFLLKILLLDKEAEHSFNNDGGVAKIPILVDQKPVFSGKLLGTKLLKNPEFPCSIFCTRKGAKIRR